MSRSSPSNCSSCIHCKSPLAKPDDVESGVCTRCYENIVLPAYKHVESLQPDDPGRMMWHGWAVREAFIAGALHAKANAGTERPALTKVLDMQPDSQTPATCEPASEAPVRSSDLVRRLHAHIAMMAPHQKERYSGKLLIEATAEIRKLQTTLCDLMPYVLEDYYPNCATPGYKAAVEAAKALTPNVKLSDRHE